MGAALEQAALSLAAGEMPIGAVVAADGEIVAGPSGIRATACFPIPSWWRYSRRTAAASRS
jgi:tRNA(Arg) A34 adenosine deaminase TadA